MLTLRKFTASNAPVVAKYYTQHTSTEIAESLIVVQQSRTNNAASIRLHESLGFEIDGNILQNRHANDVLIYVKVF